MTLELVSMAVKMSSLRQAQNGLWIVKNVVRIEQESHRAAFHWPVR